MSLFRRRHRKPIQFVFTGRVYRHYPNGVRKDVEIVRVVRFNQPYVVIKGPARWHTPYNFASAENLHRPTLLEVQQFLEKMPL